MILQLHVANTDDVATGRQQNKAAVFKSTYTVFIHALRYVDSVYDHHMWRLSSLICPLTRFAARGALQLTQTFWSNTLND